MNGHSLVVVSLGGLAAAELKCMPPSGVSSARNNSHIICRLPHGNRRGVLLGVPSTADLKTKGLARCAGNHILH
jgi:hypothetical protein